MKGGGRRILASNKKPLYSERFEALRNSTIALIASAARTRLKKSRLTAANLLIKGLLWAKSRWVY